MPGYSKSPLAFDDVKDILERAFNSPVGLRINCPNRGAAVTLRSRLNYWRTLNRRDNAKIYPADHIMHKCSTYDNLSIRLGKIGQKDENTIYLEPRTLIGLGVTVEEIESPPEK